MTDEKPKPKRRRKQSKNIAVVESVPPYCPRCKSTDRTQKEGSLVREIGGVGQDGRPFNRVRWCYCKCKSCGQQYRVIQRELIGDNVSASEKPALTD